MFLYINKARNTPVDEARNSPIERQGHIKVRVRLRKPYLHAREGPSAFHLYKIWKSCTSLRHSDGRLLAAFKLCIMREKCFLIEVFIKAALTNPLFVFYYMYFCGIKPAWVPHGVKEAF